MCHSKVANTACSAEARSISAPTSRPYGVWARAPSAVASESEAPSWRAASCPSCRRARPLARTPAATQPALMGSGSSRGPERHRRSAPPGRARVVPPLRPAPVCARRRRVRSAPPRVVLARRASAPPSGLAPVVRSPTPCVPRQPQYAPGRECVARARRPLPDAGPLPQWPLRPTRSHDVARPRATRRRVPALPRSPPSGPRALRRGPELPALRGTENDGGCPRPLPPSPPMMGIYLVRRYAGTGGPLQSRTSPAREVSWSDACFSVVGPVESGTFDPVTSAAGTRR